MSEIQTAPLEGEVLDKLPVIYAKIEQYAPAKEVVALCLELTVAGEQFKAINDPAKVQLAAEWLARARQVLREADKIRLETTAGARAVQERINEGFGKRTQPLKALDGRVSAAVLAYQAEERQRRDAEAKALREAEERRIEAEAAERQRLISEQGLDLPPPPPPTPAPIVPEVATKIAGTYGSSAKETGVWTYEIVDIKLVPEAFLVPAEERVQKSVLNALARSAKAAAQVPGIRFYEKPTLTTRVAR